MTITKYNLFYQNMKMIESSVNKESAYDYINGILTWDLKGEKINIENPLVKSMYETSISSIKYNGDARNRARSKKAAEPFVKPTLEEVKNVIKEKKYNVNAEIFYSYYEERDWHYKTGEIVKDWKKALVRWNLNSWNKPSSSFNPDFRKVSESDIDDFFKMAENR